MGSESNFFLTTPLENLFSPQANPFPPQNAPSPIRNPVVNSFCGRFFFIQRDRPIIKKLLADIEEYSKRNHRKRDEKIESERRRQHEEQHAQAPGGGLAEAVDDQRALTAGGIAVPGDQEEEKEVDPSIVGSLDNVYRDNPDSSLKEDPFKKVPMMDDHEKPSSMMEMEKNVDAMVALVEHNAPGSPIPDDAPPTPDSEMRDPLSAQNFRLPEHLPDLVGVRGGGVAGGEAVPASGGIPLDLAVGAQRGVDLLENEGAENQEFPSSTTPSQPVDLTKGLGALTVVSTSS